MDRTFIQEMEAELKKIRAEILKKFISENEDFRHIVNNLEAKDYGDIAADDVAASKMEAINKHDSNRLQQVESAISRIHNNRYGKCLKCGKSIPESRLRAIPYAVLCIDCKNEDEKTKRRERA
ncbi:MAG: TraR/DksA family transcriptional regulator [Spirochaetota bacterium]